MQIRNKIAKKNASEKKWNNKKRIKDVEVRVREREKENYRKIGIYELKSNKNQIVSQIFKKNQV